MMIRCIEEVNDHGRLRRRWRIDNAPTRLRVDRNSFNFISMNAAIVMADDVQARIIEQNPIGNGLDVFRTLFNSFCEEKSLSYTADGFNHFIQNSREGMLMTSA